MSLTYNDELFSISILRLIFERLIEIILIFNKDLNFDRLTSEIEIREKKSKIDINEFFKIIKIFVTLIFLFFFNLKTILKFTIKLERSRLRFFFF